MGFLTARLEACPSVNKRLPRGPYKRSERFDLSYIRCLLIALAARSQAV